MHTVVAPAGVPFARDLRRHGGRPAAVAPDGTTLTYRELADRVETVGEVLGPTPRLVLVAAGTDVDPLVTYLAALRGGHPVLLTACDRLDTLAAAYDPDIVLAPSGAGWELRERRPGTAHDLHPDLALLLSTSGSTGSPKLVRLSAAGVQANAESITEYLDIRDTDRAAAMLPLHYCYGLSVVNSNLLRGAAVVLTDRSVVDPAFWANARAHRVTSLHGVPHTFELLERAGWPELASLRYVTQAGGRLAPDRVRSLAERGAAEGWWFYVMYGQTEATARMAYLPPELAASRPGAIGIAVPGGELALAPLSDGDDLDDPACGELIYRGPNVMLGYADGPGDLALGRTVEELATGDLARRDPDGIYELIGRRSRFVKLFGLRIDLDGVERFLAGDGVTAACAGDDTRLVVAVTGPDPEPVATAAAAYLGLPGGSVVAVAVPELPRLPSGKVDHAAVAALGRTVASARRRPRDASVRAVFARVLRCPDVPGNATFASLGGDSLSYVEMSLALEDLLGHLPADWPTRKVDELEGSGRRRRRGTAVETTVVLRAVAIALIVSSHVGLLAVAGGAHLLLALAGWSFARFALLEGPVSIRLIRSGVRIAVPTVAWVAWRAATQDDVGLHNVLLVNFLLDPGTWGYWFIETLLQILVVLAVLFAIPAVRRCERRLPFAFALVALALALTAQQLGLPDNEYTDRFFSPHTVLWIFVLGWLAQRAAAMWQKAAVAGLTLLLIPGFFDDPVRGAVVAAGLLLALAVPRVVLPRIAARTVGLLAAASLYIYLTHYAVQPALLPHLPVAVVAAACLAVGVLAWLAVDHFTRLVGAALRGSWRRAA
ncbi:AMP-binding protein [Pseudonocardia nigra]|uniref:AMP-binding protein n=1 Tax=Pseudonocardia nigra TaxID=1921578 RepID=UPI0027E2EF10|nr:AMP-binding protein [Pseudonocardia nigra]